MPESPKAAKSKKNAQRRTILSGPALARLLEKLRPLAEEVAAPLGLEVIGIESALEGGNRVVRAVFDRPGSGEKGEGVTLDDLTKAARKLSVALDADDPSETGPSFVLEASSPGLDRRLAKEEDFRRYSGRLAKIKLTVDGRKATFRGRLATSEGPLRLVTDEGEITFLAGPDVKASLIPEF